MVARGIRNIGPTSQEWLDAVGVRNIGDLMRLGPVLVMEELLRAGFPANLNLLYALHAAVEDCHWQELTADVRRELTVELGRIRARVNGQRAGAATPRKTLYRPE